MGFLAARKSPLVHLTMDDKTWGNSRVDRPRRGIEERYVESMPMLGGLYNSSNDLHSTRDSRSFVLDLALFYVELLLVRVDVGCEMKPLPKVYTFGTLCVTS